MLSTLPVGDQARPQTRYRLIMNAQAMHPQTWRPSILLAAIAPQPP
jgi:hypothetical protein